MRRYTTGRSDTLRAVGGLGMLVGLIGVCAGLAWDIATCTEYSTRVVQRMDCVRLGDSHTSCTTRPVVEPYCSARGE